MPKAVVVYDWIGRWSVVEDILDSMGWGYYSLGQPTKEEVMAALADPEVIAYFAQGHGNAYSFGTVGGSITANDIATALANRSKPMLCYLQHCDALNTTSGACWVQALSKGDLSDIAITGMRYWDNFVLEGGAHDHILLKRMLEYISEGMTVYKAWQEAVIETPTAYDPSQDWGITFIGDETVRITEERPKPRAMVLSKTWVTDTDDPWYVALKNMGYHVIFFQYLCLFVNNVEVYRAAIEAVFKKPEVEIYVLTSEGNGTPYNLEIFPGYPECDLSAQEIAGWMLDRTVKMKLVVLEHRDSMLDADPAQPNWVGAFSQSSLQNIALIGYIGRPYYSTNGPKYETWRNQLLGYLGQGKTISDSFQLSRADCPEMDNLLYGSQVLFLGDGTVRLTEEAPPEPEESYSYIFASGEVKTATIRIAVSPEGLPCTMILWLSSDGTIRDAEAEIAFTSSGVELTINIPIQMPLGGFIYQVFLDVKVKGEIISSFTAIKKILVPQLTEPEFTWEEVLNANI